MALESDLIKISRFIEFDTRNFQTFSIELAHLLLAATSELDVVLKGLCNHLSPNDKHENIFHYKNTIKTNFSRLIEMKVVCSRYGLDFLPFKNWENDEPPEWWTGYNKIKHERSTNYHKANLENTLNSMAALFIINIYFNHETFISSRDEYPYDLRHSYHELRPRSDLFMLDDFFLNLFSD